MAVTLKTLARMAGLSESTISRCLNDSPLVAEETKERVLRLAQEQGFHFNANARGLSSKKNYTIGVIYPDNRYDFHTSQYYNTLNHQLRDRIEAAGYDVIVSFTKSSQDAQSHVKRLILAGKVDGLILAGSIIDESTYHFLSQSDTPFVLMHHLAPYQRFCPVDSVCPDNTYGGYLAARHLLETGCRHLMTLTATADKSREFVERTAGFKQALREFEVPIEEALILSGPMQSDWAYQTIMEHQQLLPKVDGIFAQTDLMAFGVMQALRVLGYTIPDQISLVGYDDIDLTRITHPTITTIHQPREEIARLTCENLLKVMKHADAAPGRQVVLQPTLVVRDSTRPLPKDSLGE